MRFSNYVSSFDEPSYFPKLQSIQLLCIHRVITLVLSQHPCLHLCRTVEYSAISNDWSECLLYGAVWWMFNQALYSGGANVERFDFSKNNKVLFFHRNGQFRPVCTFPRSRELILPDGWIVKWASDIVPTDIKPIGNAARISGTHLKSRYY